MINEGPSILSANEEIMNKETTTINSINMSRTMTVQHFKWTTQLFLITIQGIHTCNNKNVVQDEMAHRITNSWTQWNG